MRKIRTALVGNANRSILRSVLALSFLTICLPGHAESDVDFRSDDHGALEKVVAPADARSDIRRAFRTKSGMAVPIDGFFDRHAREFGLGMHDEMRVVRESNALRGKTRRYQRYYRGVPVLGSPYLVHFVDGNVVSGQGLMANIGEPDVTPRIDDADAEHAALSDLSAKLTADAVAKLDTVNVETRLALLPVNESARLVYEVRLQLSDRHYVTLVDGTLPTPSIVRSQAVGKASIWSGSISNQIYNNQLTPFDGYVSIVLVDDVVSLPGPVSSSYTETTVSVHEGTPNGSEYSPASAITWCAPNEASPSTDAFYLSGPNAAQMDPACEMPAAIATQWFTEWTLKFYGDELSWYGLDGGGQSTLNSVLHFDPSWSFWADGVDGQYDNVSLYDDRIDYRAFTGTNPFTGEVMLPATHASVIGHEIAHGVAFYAAGPDATCVDPSGTQFYESGMLDEAFADMLSLSAFNFRREKSGFATTVRSLPRADGLSVYREFVNPTVNTYMGKNYFPTPDTCGGYDFLDHQQKFAVMYGNGGFVRRWYDLLAQTTPTSGVNDNLDAFNVVGIGRERTTELVFRTLADHWSVGLGVYDLRLATINAAEQIAASQGQPFAYKSVTTLSAMDAWHAVGVGDDADLTLEEMGEIQVSPKNGATNIPPWTWTGSQATLSRDALYGQAEKSVTFVISSDSTFATNVVQLKNDSQSDGAFGRRTFYLHINLAPNTKYYWRSVVNEVDGNGCAVLGFPEDECAKVGGTWGAVRSFTTGNAITSWIPANDRDYPWNSHLTWNPVNGALAYHLKCSTNSVFDTAQDAHIFDQEVPLTNNNSGMQEARVPMLVDENEFCLVQASGPPDETALQDILSNPDAVHNYGAWSGNGVPIEFHTRVPEAKLISPDDGKHVFWTVTLTWEPVEGAQGYSFQLSETPDFSPGQFFEEYKQGNQATTHTIEYDSLSEEGTRYWRVIPVGPAVGGYPFGQEGGEGEIWSFVVDFKATAPTPISPVDIDVDAYESTTSFEWSDVPGATNYQLKVYSLDENEIYEGDFGPTNTATISGVSDPYVGKKGFCWTIQASKGSVEGQISKACYGLGPDMPFQFEPQYGETGVGHSDNNPTYFAWNSRYAPYGYRLQWGEENSSDIDADVSIRPAEKKIPLAPGVLAPRASYEAGAAYGLKANTWYRWRVFAEKKDGSEQWNGMWFRFKTDNETNEAPGSGDGGNGGGGSGGSCSAMPKPKILCPKGLGQDPHVDEYDYSFYSFNTYQPGFILKWADVSGASTYDVEVERMTYPYDAAHTTAIANQTVQAGSSSGVMSAGPFDHPAQSIDEANTPTELVLYRWVVRAVNGCGEAGPFATSQGYPSLYDPDVSSQTVQMCQ